MDILNPNLVSSGTYNVTFPVEGKADGTGYLSGQTEGCDKGFLLIQEWWGFNKSMCTKADKFSAHGFLVLVPDLYRGKVAQNREQAGHLMQGLDWAGAIQDIIAAVKFLKSKGCKKVGVAGFCMGGALTIASMTQSEEIDVGVPFYGVPDLSKFNLEAIKIPMLAHFGALDTICGFSDVAAAKNLESKAKDAGVDFTLKIWENGNHAFMNQDAPNYNKELAKECMIFTIDYLKKVF